MTKKKIIVVLGMHRSGSSAITRGLSVLGVDLGDNLMRPVRDNNEKGFFEDLDIYRFNEKVLKKAGSAWHKLARLDYDAFTGPSYFAERREAAALLARKLEARDVFAFKDPRTAILLPLWRCVFEDLGLDDRYLISVRNPLEAAASLQARDGFPFGKGVFLWAKHMIEAVRSSAGKPRIFVRYDRLLSDPEAELRRVADTLELETGGLGGDALREYKEEFLERGLRHNHIGVKELERSGLAPPFVITLYDQLEAWAAAPVGEAAKPKPQAWRALEERYDEIAPLLDYADVVDEQIAAAQTKAKEADAAREQTAGALKEKAEALAKTLAEKAATLGELKRTQDTLNELRRSNAEEIGMLSEARANAEAEIRRLKAERRRLAESARAQAEKLEAAERERARLKEDVQGVRLRASEAETKVTRLEATSAAQLRQIETLGAERARLDEERRERVKEALLLRAEAAAVRRSTSWRLTAPLRAAMRIIRNPIKGSRDVASRLARMAWRSLPMPAEKRGDLAATLFSAAPFLFFWSGAFRAWKTEGRAAPAAREADLVPLDAPVDPELEGCVPLRAKTPPASVPVRTIAFYLPQFHPIPENDAWWGDRFTEWTKVKPAAPLFEGHYQPHVPGELGYYDLVLDKGVMARQAELARLHGLSGFCFYFYWFAGKRLLEAPVLNYLENKQIDFPFCLCWANENWSRRWDGREDDILIAQDHSPEDDLAFIAHVARYMRDPRYIRIDGRPLLIVYRPALLPSSQETAARWRRWARENGLGELYLAYTQSFGRSTPSGYGLDAAIEFPPNNMGLEKEPSLTPGLSADSALSVYDWRKMAGRSRRYSQEAFKIFRGVNPGWDNTARRPRDGAVFLGATPSLYKAWVENAVRDTVTRFDNPEERLVFVNAWNEWAEGAHLEPDQRHGYAWLEATRRALEPAAAEIKKKILIVTHDLHRHGAQYVALNLARTLNRRFGISVATISGGPGELAAEFEREGPLAIVNEKSSSSATVDAVATRFASEGYSAAIVNSAASGWLAPALARARIEMIGLVHELPDIIRGMALEDGLRALDAHALAVVFPATLVRDGSARAAGLARWRNPLIRPQGVYHNAGLANSAEKEEARRSFVSEHRLPPGARIVVGAGYGDHRKGVDIFIEWAIAAARRWPDLYFFWLGKIDPAMEPARAALMKRAGDMADRMRFPGFVDVTDPYYRAASLYALTSREDPFPSMALEALSAEAPVVMVSGTGGIEDLAARGCVRAIASPQPEEFVAAAADWLDDEPARQAAGRKGAEFVRAELGFSSYAAALAGLLRAPVPDISVVVPNYNYAHHLEQRLQSILDQTLSPREIIFLDDASSDDSIAVAARVLRASPINWRIVHNETNSGSVFKQWRKGAALAKGELLWIAEADDWADSRFLETAAKGLEREDVVLSFTQSNQATADGRVTAAGYQEYLRDVSPEKWTRAFVGEGPDEAREGFSVKNAIPNVSAVVFRRRALLQVFDAREKDILSYRVAGDWCVYANLLKRGAIAYSPQPLNYHRRHDASVTIGRFGLAELAEIARMQAYVAREFAPAANYRAKARAYLEGLVAHFGLEARFPRAAIEAAMAGVAP